MYWHVTRRSDQGLRHGFFAGPYLALLVMALAMLACNIQLGGEARPQAPEGYFIGPAKDTVFAEGAAIELAAAFTDPIGSGIARVDFQVNGQNVHTITLPASAPQYTARYRWTAQGQQGHFITAEAFRTDGSSIISANLNIVVIAPPGFDGTIVAMLAMPTATSGMESTSAPASKTEAATTTSPTSIPVVASPTSLDLVGNAPTIPVTQTSVAPVVSLVTPTFGAASPTNPGASTLPAPILSVKAPFLNVRAGPGTNYPQIGQLNQNVQARVIGRNDLRTWVVIESGALRGWVITSPDIVEIVGDTSALPLVAAPDAPQAPATQPVGGATAAPVTAPGDKADLIIENVQLVPQMPRVNQTFDVVISVRNQGVVASGSSLLQGVFQPNGEISQMAVPPIPPGGLVTLPPMKVTLRGVGNNLTAVLSLDIQSEVDEGQTGEQNNQRSITYNVVN
jgi:uncharacterized protein YgiM (DUF1202 family)